MPNFENQSPIHKKHFYGRRKGHTLSPRQEHLLENLLPKLAITLSIEDKGLIDVEALFARKADPLWLEIGFGKGEHLATQAGWRPDVNFIGCEPFVNGVVGLLDAINDSDINNVRIYPDDARDVLDCLPAGSVERVFLLHPDPWPKNKHEKRRFVNQENLKSIARVMQDGAELRIGTDHTHYARWTMFQFYQSPYFSWNAESADHWRLRPDNWPETRYQQKALKDGVNSVYLSFTRTSR